MDWLVRCRKRCYYSMYAVRARHTCLPGKPWYVCGEGLLRFRSDVGAPCRVAALPRCLPSMKCCCVVLLCNAAYLRGETIEGRREVHPTITTMAALLKISCAIVCHWPSPLHPTTHHPTTHHCNIASWRHHILPHTIAPLHHCIALDCPFDPTTAAHLPTHCTIAPQHLLTHPPFNGRSRRCAKARHHS